MWCASYLDRANKSFNYGQVTSGLLALLKLRYNSYPSELGQECMQRMTCGGS